CDAMKNAGAVVEVIASKSGQELKGKNGSVKVKADVAVDQVRPESYQALFIPGGYSPDHLRMDKRFVDFVRNFDGLKRPVAAICHGAQLLMAAKLVRGRTLTAWPTVQSDLELAGANVKDEAVVIDGNWITSRKPDDLKPFSEALLRTLH
ncbi:MAG TPA: type 1 glutamine amidotransferase domain-containing protein, partial [Anaeromyxobacteraceae bacterium]|nr:type 1 glutamine amidotransferase domain-containing protein [Anaeromyxobacteraceae bacterium]